MIISCTEKNIAYEVYNAEKKKKRILHCLGPVTIAKVIAKVFERIAYDQLHKF